MPLTDAAKIREHAAQERLRNGFARRLTSLLSAEFRRVASALAKAYGSSEATDRAIKIHNHKLLRILEPEYRRLFMEFGPRGVRLARGQTKEEPDFQALADAFVKKWAKKRTGEITATTQQRLTDIVARGSAEGLNEREVAESIDNEIGGDFGYNRGKVIARTESHAASQAALITGVASLGVDFLKEWVSVKDKRTRDDHRDVDPKPIPMDEPFMVGGEPLQFPGDPDGPPEQVINCRCVVVFRPA